MPGLAQQLHCKRLSEVRNVSIDMRGELDGTEVCTGTPTVTVTGLTISGEAVSTTALTILGETVPIGQAVQFAVAGGTAGTDYEIDVQCGTNSSQTLRVSVMLEVVAD